MARKTKRQIESAVHACMALCCQTDMPLACLADSVALLRQNDWCDEDLHQVERAVVKLLAALVEKSPSDFEDDGGDAPVEAPGMAEKPDE